MGSDNSLTSMRGLVELATKSLDDIVQQRRESLLNHAVYHRINTIRDLQIYTAHHVFAVWDFMSLLKRLQHDLTGLDIPWRPRGEEPYTRFINEIVVAEESDEVGNGHYQSHFGLYQDAMVQLGADRAPINFLLAQLEQGVPWEKAVEALSVDPRVKEFIRFDLNLAQHGETYEVAAAFFYGREDIIPEMFLRIVDKLGTDARLERFRYYLERHIEVDSDTHGPLAAQLLDHLCGRDPAKLERATVIAREALQWRIKLFDTVVDRLSSVPS